MDIPNEDELLCKHNYINLDMGVHRQDPDMSIATFYCKKCLDIRTRLYNSANYYMDKELREDVQNDR